MLSSFWHVSAYLTSLCIVWDVCMSVCFFACLRRCLCKCWYIRDLWQAQWEYFDNSDYEPYPEEINIIIENAYQDKKPYAEWEEKSARYRLTFENMEEEMANDASSKVKVRRNTKGELWLAAVISWSSFCLIFTWAFDTKIVLSQQVLSRVHTSVEAKPKR